MVRPCWPDSWKTCPLARSLSRTGLSLSGFRESRIKFRQAEEPVWQLELDKACILARRRVRDAEFLRVQPGASVSVAAERAGSIGKRTFVFFCASDGGEIEFGRVRGGI